ncbi:MAG TPA: hypothetical protein VNA17_05125 [Pyrinomonadaceae bacterium]|nr:hypothetical protein [Pyrinomonadaceae bacterium]
MLRNSYRILFFLFLAAAGLSAQDPPKTPNASGMPVLWEAVSIREADLKAGPGGEHMLPDISTVTFVEEQKGGHSKKYKIKDAAGKTWVAKIGDEAQSETAAVRLLSAIGYKTDINYLVPTLTIPGKGTFTNVRLEARPDDVKRGKTWSWKKNPFKGTREFQGLKIMMAFLNNWDMKEANNVILQRADKVEYAISDLGVSFGKTGNKGLPIFWRIGRSRNVPEEYAEAEFIKNIKDGKINFNFNGKNDGSLADIKHEDGRWLADLLIQLSDQQIEDAFRAANYTDAEVAVLAGSVKNRIRALDLATQHVSKMAVGEEVK